MKAVVFAPQYTEEQRNTAKRLTNFLKGSVCSFMDSEIINKSNINEINKESVSLLARLSLALDIFLMYKHCDCCVGVLNGKDEAVLIKIGIAYALGVPVYLYKYDPRTSFIAGENSMILGLSEYTVFKCEKKLAKKIYNDKKKFALTDFDKLPKTIQTLIELGADVYDFYFVEAKQDIFGLIDKYKNTAIINEFLSSKKVVSTQKEKNKIYCSGPLFCPSEHREMKKISDIFEKNGIDTYLPQRDGAEPYFLESMDSSFSAIIFVKPIIKLIHKIIFTIDVKEIAVCSCFSINLNGRYYDEGAMAELGIAFAFGKTIVLYHNDQRNMFTHGLHPLPLVMSQFPVVRKVEDLPNVINELIKLEKSFFDINNLNQKVIKAYNWGKRFSKFFSYIKIPKNKMLGWLKEYE